MLTVSMLFAMALPEALPEPKIDSVSISQEECQRAYGEDWDLVFEMSIGE